MESIDCYCMQCPEYDPGPGHPEKLRLKVTHTDRERHGDTVLRLRLSPKTTSTLRSICLWSTGCRCLRETRSETFRCDVTVLLEDCTAHCTAMTTSASVLSKGLWIHPFQPMLGPWVAGESPSMHWVDGCSLIPSTTWVCIHLHFVCLPEALS